MLSHYVRLALRRLRLDADYALVNLISLVAGMTCCFVLLAVVVHEVGYDRGFTEPHLLHRVAFHFDFEGIEEEQARGPSALLPAVEASFPEVEAAAALIEHAEVLVRRPEGDLELRHVFHASPRFFDVFDFPFRYGDPATALSEPAAVVLTHETALRLFGRADVLGQPVRLSSGATRTVTGVLRPALPRSHLRFEALVHLPDGLLTVWNGSVALTYLRLRPGTDPGALTRRLNAYIDRHAPNEWKGVLEAFLQPVLDIHLRSHLEGEVSSNADLRSLGVLALAALLTLLMAVTSYVNLSTARLTGRGIEIGVRKAVGASRRQVAGQLLGEAIATAVLAAPVALLLLVLLRPLLYDLTGVPLALDLRGLLLLGAGAAGLCVLVGLVAGLYPALVLSGFSPLQALRGERWQGRGAVRLRRLFVGFQFFVTLAFVLTTVVVVTQLRYVAQKDLGFEPGGVLYARVWERVPTARYEALRASFLAVDGVRAVSYGSLPGIETGGFVVRDEAGRSLLVHRFLFGPGYAEVLRMRLAGGRSFRLSGTGGSAHDLLLNESAARLLGAEVGEPVTARLVDGVPRTVVGVVEDFHFFSLHQPVAPVFSYPATGVGPYLLLRVEDPAAPHLHAALAAVWERLLPESPFAPGLLSERLLADYGQERRLARLLSAFALVAVVVAGLGLLAMVSYSAERRRRELAIRRVLGASAGHVGWALAAESVGLFAVAALAALAGVLGGAPWWLAGFAYRAPLSPGPFAAILLATFLLTFSVVWFRVFRVVLEPPAAVLRQL